MFSGGLAEFTAKQVPAALQSENTKEYFPKNGFNLSFCHHTSMHLHCQIYASKVWRKLSAKHQIAMKILHRNVLVFISAASQ